MSSVSPVVPEGDAPSAKPVPKVTAAGVAGAIVTLVLAIAAAAGLDVGDDGSQVDWGEVAASAVATLASFGAAYMKRGLV